MITTSHVVAGARTVRIVAACFTIGLVVGFIAISSFTSQYGQSAPVTLDSTSNDMALDAAIQKQESVGLTCTKKPTLTDVVLFQRELADEVVVVTFDEAIEASSARAGWIRRYCATP